MTPSPARVARPRAAHLVLVAIAAAAIAAGVASARGAAGPTNTSDPTITGVALTGNTLQASPGTWSPTAGVTFSYRWLRCDPAGGDDSSDKTCATIDGATRQFQGGRLIATMQQRMPPRHRRDILLTQQITQRNRNRHERTRA